MSVYHVVPLGCSACGRARPVKVVDSANPLRHPPFLDALLARTFNRFPCPSCDNVDVLERPMLWTDVHHDLVAWMLPSSQRPAWSTVEIEVLGGLEGPVRWEGPPLVRSWGQRAAIRLVFGLEELRDKVVARRAMLDDRVVEILKLPYGDGDDAKGPVLEAVDATGLQFTLDGAAVATVHWEEYRRVAAIDHSTSHPGLYDGTWVHWLRAPFCAHRPMAPALG
jgi:hypothetical protein